MPARAAARELSDAEVAGLLDLGRSAGLDAVGIAGAEPLERALAALVERRERGLHAGMAFTYRNPERSTDPGAAVRDARSIIVGARGYLMDEPARPDVPSARIARYAWVDHYEPLRTALRAMAAPLRAAGWRAVVFADDNSIVDREVAWRAGIGWFGKNANLLLPRAGSWFVLGCVITDAPLPHAAGPQPDGCGACRRCVDGCPTAAIIEPGVVDANRCLSWLLQRPGVFPREHRVALGDRLYGCDDCQEVCPPNVRVADPARRPPAALHPRSARPGGAEDAAAGAPAVVPVEPATRPDAPATDEPDAWVGLVDLLTADDETILDRLGRFYLHDRETRWLRRNALLVLGNIGDGSDPDAEALLRRSLADADPVLRAHAVWAAARLARQDLVPRSDPDPMVRAELDDLPMPRRRP